MHAMTWPQALLVATAAAASMASYWFMICAVLPSIRLRQAAVVNLGSNAVANTLPAGGALALGVSWAMLSSWEVSTAEYVLYTLISGIWNIFARLGLPVLALVVLMTVSRPGAGLIAAAAVGLALLATAAAGLGLLLRSEPFAVRAGHALQSVLVIGCRLVRRPPPGDVSGSFPGFRDRAAGLIAARGWRITAATAASQLALWLVLLACLRAIGLSQAQVPWQTSLAAFAWNSRKADVEKPDEWRIDLDPGPECDFATVRGSLTSPTRCSTTSARPAGPRPAAVAACTSMSASARTTASPTCAGPRSPSRVRSSGACPRTSRPPGGAGTATPPPCSSTTTRTPATTPSLRRTACAAPLGGPCRPRSVGRGRRGPARRPHDRHGAGLASLSGDLHGGLDEAVLRHRTVAGARRPGRSMQGAAPPVDPED